MKRLSVLLAVIGLMLGTALVGSFGFDRVTQGVASAGWRGFAVLCLWQFVIVLPLGLAWDQLARIAGRGRLLLHLWGRMVRDASTNCLPFSVLGGFVIGGRALTLHGVPWPAAFATTVVDVTAEFLAELGFIGLGIAILIAQAPRAGALAMPLEIGLGFAILGVAAFIWLQRGAAPVFGRLAARIARRRLDSAQQGIEAVNAEMTELYRSPARLFACFVLHFIGWLLSGMWDWFAFHLIGFPIDVDQAMAIEALLSGASAVAFLVPVSAGVQEASYAGFGALFGVPAELSLAVALIRRARDVVIGVPILLLWQMIEVRRLRRVPGQA